jgi:sec-independent protein translocase protein TatA
MGSLGVPELIIIFLVVLLVFGAKRIPEIARGLGKGIREFKDATTDIKREFDVEDARSEPTRRVEAPRHPPAPRADSPAQRQPEPAERRPDQPDVENSRQA